jgi:hypothetical protein
VREETGVSDVMRRIGERQRGAGTAPPRTVLERSNTRSARLPCAADEGDGNAP